LLHYATIPTSVMSSLIDHMTIGLPLGTFLILLAPNRKQLAIFVSFRDI